MANEINMRKAREIYNTLNEVLTKFGRSPYEQYEKHEDELLIKCVSTVQGLRIPFILLVDPKRELVRLHSQLSFTFPKMLLVDASIAVCKVNTLGGDFDFDLSDYKINFRTACSYRNSIIGKDSLDQMIYGSLGTIRRYNDIFEKLATGEISPSEFSRFADEKFLDCLQGKPF